MHLRVCSIPLAIAAALALTGCNAARQGSAPAPSLAARTVNQFQRNGGVHRGFRRNHAKGVCVAGYFQSSGKAAAYSVAQVFAPGQRTPVMGRLSIPGTNPYAWDSGTPIRGMALVFTQADGQQWRTAMNAVPAFPVATPQANLAFLKAQQPLPATGDPDPAKLAAFFASHPRANAFRKWDRNTPPSASFATVQYNSVDSFELVDVRGRQRAVRWAMVPFAHGHARAPVNRPDYLFKDLRRRLADGSLRWHLVITFAAPGDAVDNPSIAWPQDRRHVDAGTLVIQSSQPQAHGPCRGVNFNPLVLPTGIEPSADPVLLFRAKAYAVSHRRRVREHARESRTRAPATVKSAQGR